MKIQGTPSFSYLYKNITRGFKFYFLENFRYIIRSSEDKEFGHMLVFKNKSIAEEFKKLKNYSEKQDFINKYCLYMSPFSRFTESDKEGWIPSGLP